jgi:hypothetical protein
MVISVTLLYDTASDVTRSEVKEPYSCERATLMAPVPLPVKPISTMRDRLHHQTRPVVIEYARDRSASATSPTIPAIGTKPNPFG